MHVEPIIPESPKLKLTMSNEFVRAKSIAVAIFEKVALQVPELGKTLNGYILAL